MHHLEPRAPRFSSSCVVISRVTCGHVEALRLPGKLDRFHQGDPSGTDPSFTGCVPAMLHIKISETTRCMMGMHCRLWPMQIQVWNESSKPCAQLKFWTPVRFRMASLSTIARIKNTWNTRVSARHPLCRLQGSCLGRVGPA